MLCKLNTVADANKKIKRNKKRGEWKQGIQGISDRGVGEMMMGEMRGCKIYASYKAKQ